MGNRRVAGVGTGTLAAGWRRRGWPLLATAGVVSATVAALLAEGRRWWCACGGWNLWTGDVWGSHNSQHLVDPYSFTHLLHGLVFCGLLAVAAPRLGVWWRQAAAVAIEGGWEVLENSAFVIDRYRTATAARGYEGDTVVNSLGDVLSCAAGFWLATRLGFRKSLAVFVAVELVMVACIRDNLTLNVLMLVCPIDAVRTWQAAGGG